MKGSHTSIILRLSLVGCALMTSPLVHAQPPQAAWDRANESTVRLEPRAFSKLPSSVRVALERRGCTVPQTFEGERPENVVRGHFKGGTQTTWAALCSRNRRSAVLVFHGRDFGQIDELADAADADYLGTIGGGRIGFSRRLTTIGAKRIKRFADSGDDPVPQTIDHDGIDDAWVGKGSVIWYWHGGKWIWLVGAD